MVLDAVLLITQHYKVRIKGKVEQSKEWSSAPHQHLWVVAIEKRAFGSPSTMVANLLMREREREREREIKYEIESDLHDRRSEKFVDYTKFNKDIFKKNSKVG